MKYFYSFLMCFSFWSPLAFAQQVQEFTVDTVTSEVTQKLPFDRPFVLKLKGNNASSLTSAFFLELKIRKRGGQIVRTFYEDFRSVDVLPKDVFHRKDGVDLYVNSLGPNKSYLILLAHHFDEDLLDNIYESNYLLHKDQDDKAKLILDKVPDKVTDRVERIIGVTDNEKDNLLKFAKTFNSRCTDGKSFTKCYSDFFRCNLKANYTKIDRNVRTQSYPNLLTSNANPLLKYFNKFGVDSIGFSTLVVLLSRYSTTQIELGNVAISDNENLVEDFSLSERLDNLTISKKALNSLLKKFEFLKTRTSANVVADFKDDLNNLLVIVENNRKIIKDELAEIQDKIDNNANLNYSTWASGNNELTDLKTKGSYQLIPEIGVVNIFAIGNVKNENIVRPYVGASFYFRPVDKSIPFKYMTKEFLHRFSLKLGITVGKVEKGEFSDLYNNFTLLGGVNFKVTQALAFSAGCALMQRKNRIPAIDDKKTVFNPFLGILFDVDFTNSIQSLTSKIF